MNVSNHSSAPQTVNGISKMIKAILIMAVIPLAKSTTIPFTKSQNLLESSNTSTTATAGHLVTASASASSSSPTSYSTSPKYHLTPPAPLTQSTTTRSSQISFSSEPHTTVGFTSSTTSKTTLTTPGYSDSSFLEVLANVMTSNETVEFLNQFHSKNKRKIVETQLRECPFTPLCTFSLNVTLPQVTVNMNCCDRCFCDGNCTIFGNCCPDIIPESVYEMELPYKSKFTCEPMQLASRQLQYEQEGSYMISDCPLSSDHYLQEKCSKDYGFSKKSKLIDVSPVEDTSTGIVYRNIFCAKCNNISQTEIKVAEDVFKCRHFKVATPFDTTEEGILHSIYEGIIPCIIHFESLNFSKCSLSISNCSKTGDLLNLMDPVEQGCGLYGSVITQKINEITISFNNIFCMRCNGFSQSDFDCIYKSSIHKTRYSFAILLDFKESYSPVTLPTADVLCKKNFAFEHLTKSCREIQCSPLRKIINGICMKEHPIFDSGIITITLKMEPKEDLTLLQAYVDADVVISSTVSSFLNGNILKNTFYITCRYDILLVSNTTYSDTIPLDKLKFLPFSHYLIRYQIEMHSVYDPEKIFTVLTNGLRDKVYTSFDEIETRFYLPEAYDDKAELFDTAGNLDIALPEIENMFIKGAIPTDRLYLKDVMTDGIVIPLKSSRMDSQTCKNPETYRLFEFMPCRKFQISKNDLNWHYTRSGISFSGLQLNLSFTEFVHSKSDNGSIMICFEKFIRNKTDGIMTDTLNSEEVLSMICIGISTVSLMLTLLVYIIFSTLRTVPGKNIMALCLNLLFSQSMYLLSSFNSFDLYSLECQIVGLLTHFFWLTSFFWMNICTFHTYRVLTKTRSMVRGSEWKRFLFYHCYSIIASAFIVLVNVCISIFYLKTETFGYGVRFCYISSGRMIAYTFAIPLALILLSNVVMFTRVIYSVRKTSKIQRSTANERNDIKVFAKLSTITGLTWIFGFASAWTEIDVFSYVFIVLNGGQGVLIFISFVCNARVLALVSRLGQRDVPSESYTVRSTASTNRTD